MPHARIRFCVIGILFGILMTALVACNQTVTIVTTTTGNVASPTPMLSTSTPSPTASPSPGICNPADFPSGVGPVGTKQDGPPTKDFAYPPLTYYLSEGGAAGNHVDIVCSSGDGPSILAFMTTSILQSGWAKIASSTNALSAEKPTSPPSGFCYTLQMMVGQQAAYPGEWEINFHSPAATCSH